MLQTGQLVVGQAATVGGEGARATRVEQFLLAGAGPQSLAEEDVRWVLVERTTPGPLGDAQRTLDQLEPIFADDELALYRVPGASHRIPGTVAARPSRPTCCGRRCWRAAG